MKYAQEHHGFKCLLPISGNEHEKNLLSKIVTVISTLPKLKLSLDLNQNTCNYIVIVSIIRKMVNTRALL